MKNLIIAVAVVLLLGSTAHGGWYVGPTVGYRYYAPAPVVVAGPQVVYAPVAPVQVVVPAPVVVGRPVVVGPAGRAYIVGRPIRNAIRAVLP